MKLMHAFLGATLCAGLCFIGTLNVSADAPLEPPVFFDFQRLHRLLQAERLLTGGEYVEAQAEWEDLAETARDEVAKSQSLAGAARALGRQEGEYESALMRAEKIPYGPYSAFARIWLMARVAEDYEGIVKQFGQDDLDALPNPSGRDRRIPGNFFANELAEGYYLLARAYYEQGQGEAAETVLRKLIEAANLGVSHGWERRFYHHVLNLYKNNYERYLSDNQKVRDRYVQMRLDYGNRVAGRQAEALASYQSALEVEGMSAHLREAVMKAINAIKGDE